MTNFSQVLIIMDNKTWMVREGIDIIHSMQEVTSTTIFIMTRWILIHAFLLSNKTMITHLIRIFRLETILNKRSLLISMSGQKNQRREISSAPLSMWPHLMSMAKRKTCRGMTTKNRMSQAKSSTFCLIYFINQAWVKWLNKINSLVIIVIKHIQT